MHAYYKAVQACTEAGRGYSANYNLSPDEHPLKNPSQYGHTSWCHTFTQVVMYNIAIQLQYAYNFIVRMSHTPRCILSHLLTLSHWHICRLCTKEDILQHSSIICNGVSRLYVLYTHVRLRLWARVCLFLFSFNNIETCTSFRIIIAMKIQNISMK